MAGILIRAMKRNLRKCSIDWHKNMGTTFRGLSFHLMVHKRAHLKKDYILYSSPDMVVAMQFIHVLMLLVKADFYKAIGYKLAVKWT